MLFNSFVFLFGFLPLTLFAFYACSRFPTLAKFVLAVLSLAFYAWWRPIYLPLLLATIVFNYFVGDWIQKARAQDKPQLVKILLVGGLVTDFALLGWFKYANFVTDNVNYVFGFDIHLDHIALPLAISFYTFQKVAYLIDSARGEAKRMSFLDFTLFASFFPQLIAGPIVHYSEIVPQLQSRLFGRLLWSNMMVGLVIMTIGLFKKTVIADTLNLYVSPLYDTAAQGHALGMTSGWLAALTFTLQIYFDFSGYSDMAIGLARMFGVKLPLNFHSPLRAASIADFWRRWHMTLQRFIYAYLFQPLSLSVNRWGAERGFSGWSAFAIVYAFPTLVTFVAVGIWHGAGWTYVLFGVMHAFYIVIHEFFSERRKIARRKLRKLGKTLPEPGLYNRASAHVWTLLAIFFANVVFRSPSVATAASIWLDMIGLRGLAPTLPIDWGLAATLIVSSAIVIFFPNTQQIMGRFEPACNWREWRHVAPALIQFQWRPSVLGLTIAGAALFLGVVFIQRGQAIFLYFNF